MGSKEFKDKRVPRGRSSLCRTEVGGLVSTNKNNTNLFLSSNVLTIEGEEAPYIYSNKSYLEGCGGRFGVGSNAWSCE
jgi:hypothetical protein